MYSLVHGRGVNEYQEGKIKETVDLRETGEKGRGRTLSVCHTIGCERAPLASEIQLPRSIFLFLLTALKL